MKKVTDSSKRKAEKPSGASTMPERELCAPLAFVATLFNLLRDQRTPEDLLAPGGMEFCIVGAAPGLPPADVERGVCDDHQ